MLLTKPCPAPKPIATEHLITFFPCTERLIVILHLNQPINLTPRFYYPSIQITSLKDIPPSHNLVVQWSIKMQILLSDKVRL